MTNEAHPDTLIGRRHCTCGLIACGRGFRASHHEEDCPVYIAHLECIARLPRMVGNPEAHGADE